MYSAVNQLKQFLNYMYRCPEGNGDGRGELPNGGPPKFGALIVGGRCTKLGMNTICRQSPAVPTHFEATGGYS
jgi:hypothetical protein